MKPAVVFPGQGSQGLGMLTDLATAHDEVRTTFRQASEVLGQDLWSLSQTGPQEEIDRTVNTQPLMLTAGVAVWRAWQTRGGVQPLCLAGHSLGEYTALVCAGALPFEEALQLVHTRAQAMQTAVEEGQGAMAAVLGLDSQQLGEICNRAAEGEVVAPANLNAPQQIVISGHAQAVTRAITLAQEAGARRVVRLPVSVPSHCALMEPAAGTLQRALATTSITAPGLPVLHNTDVCSHEDPDAVRTALVHQLHTPVRWVETVQALIREGAEAVLEFGPGKVLTGLNKRIDRSLQALCVDDSASLEEALLLCEEDNR